MNLTGFVQNNKDLTQVEVGELFGFLCHITTEVPSHNTMPGGVVLCQTPTGYGPQYSCLCCTSPIPE